MSIPMRFHLYDENSNYLHTAGFMTRSHGSKSGDLISMQERLFDGFNSIKRFENVQNLRYIVCTEAPDYMFDMTDNCSIWPNKFPKI